jgi:hypothetical protein
MSLSSTLNASQSLSANNQKQLAKGEANFFNKMDALGAELKEVAVRLHDL